MLQPCTIKFERSQYLSKPIPIFKIKLFLLHKSEISHFRTGSYFLIYICHKNDDGDFELEVINFYVFNFVCECIKIS